QATTSDCLSKPLEPDSGVLKESGSLSQHPVCGKTICSMLSAIQISIVQNQGTEHTVISVWVLCKQ
ncbi:hypothetical protein LEMLEM_LOCUS8629, partial [Lemmus lemmus]